MRVISELRWNEIQSRLNEVMDLKSKVAKLKAELGEYGDINKQLANLEHRKKILEEEFKLKEKQTIAAYEDKLSKELTKLESKHMKEMNDLRNDLSEKSKRDLEELLKENYEKLSASMARLHEEGNATTKYMHDMTKEIVKSVGLSNANLSVKRIEHSGDGK